jgi:hypothetical protein
MSETSETCDCPAATRTSSDRHNRADHAGDCRIPGNLRCGSCWGCVARIVTHRAVLGSRGQHTDAEEPAA